MIPIAYPDPDFRVQIKDGNKMIFDELRRKWVVLTPEEWVRQNFLQYLVRIKLYPPSLIAIEKEIRLGELSKRFDALVYDRNHQPWMLIECKEMETSLEQRTLDQLLRYHMTVPVPYLVVTNGAFCAGFAKEMGQLVEINELPEFK
jgi:hypothetical protein